MGTGEKTMSPFKIVKVATIGGWVLGIILWASISGTLSQSKKSNTPPSSAPNISADYVGEDTCKACHEDKFNAYSGTAHATLAKSSSWKGKVTGCESCHGPGRQHVEGGGDVTKIISFKNKPAKEISETCLACHSGKEEHNNFRRGEHWRNNVGCTDCHAVHHTGPRTEPQAGSNVFVEQAPRIAAGSEAPKMLKMNEPQLCLSCHEDMTSQFNMPFHHKVLEGAMKCSDCHNAHGGFETKQARLTTGADAACVKCHADKQGPFTYEHAPVKTEGCATCHNPHGSANPRLLKRSNAFQLCLECHSQAHGVGAAEPAGPGHNLFAQYSNCTACHVKIHGSYTSPVFFR
jgi:predicted CXXCH cytochrome family protein